MLHRINLLHCGRLNYFPARTTMAIIRHPVVILLLAKMHSATLLQVS